MTGCGFEPLERAVQPFLMGRGEGWKLDSDPVRAGPAYDGALDQYRGLVFRDVEQEIYSHPREGLKETFEQASFTREIQCFTNLMEVTLVDEGAGKRRWKSGMLSHHHRSLFPTAFPLDGRRDSHWWGQADAMPVGNAVSKLGDGTAEKTWIFYVDDRLVRVVAHASW